MSTKKSNGSKMFSRRVYGLQIIKSKNSNYNADFTGAPRTLPNGTVYATDKVSKFNDRKYLGRNDKDCIFTKTTYKSDLNPMILKEVYESHFGTISDDTKKEDILKNLLTKLDVRLFGATFAAKGADNKNISIHGPVQVSYGVNRFSLEDSGVYTAQIGSPYASKAGDNQTTLGTQIRSMEAHYVHHFSINPKNLSAYVEHFKEENSDNDFKLLSVEDVSKLKKAMALATTYYDSTSKKDSENELLMWIEMNDGSEKILKNFTDLITVTSTDKGKSEIDFTKVKAYLDKFKTDISKIEIYYDDVFTDLRGIEVFEKKGNDWEIIIKKDLNEVLSSQECEVNSQEKTEKQK
ncbi:MAG: type I CRISPR-associated protein Cas7 [Desulforegulaceae bacterium]|nr:type I CRISPR-associated protein Cas7 [Desulforegulaceae bacterium]